MAVPPPPTLATRPPLMTRIRQGWNEVMGMAFASGAVVASLAAMALGVYWLYQQVV